MTHQLGGPAKDRVCHLPLSHSPIPLRDDQRRPELARKLRDNAVRSLPEERAARTLAFPDAQSVEDLTALLTSAGER